MKDRNFLAELLMKQQAPQTQETQPAAVLPVGDVAPQETQLATPIKLTPQSVLDSRQALANSLLEQSRDRSVHPIARGIAAYFGTKQSQEINRERTATEEAQAAAVAADKAREVDMQNKLFGLKETGLKADIGFKQTELDLKAKELQQNDELKKIQLERQNKLDDILIQEKQGKIAKEQADAKTKQIEKESSIKSGISQGEMVINQVDELLKHPGFTGAVGSGFQKSIPFYGAGDESKPGGGFAQGSDAAAFVERLKQLKGGAFLQAYQLLKGGGAIGEKEGQKAEASITRMSLAQDEKEFTSAAREYQSVIQQGIDNTKEKANKLGIETGGEKPKNTNSGFKILGIE